MGTCLSLGMVNCGDCIILFRHVLCWPICLQSGSLGERSLRALPSIWAAWRHVANGQEPIGPQRFETGPLSTA